MRDVGLADITADAVLAAVADCDQQGRERFLEKHGFGPARDYFLVIDGKRYDSKAIVGVAHGFSGAGLSVLTAADFGGGEATVIEALNAERFLVERRTKTAEAERRDQRLVHDYKLHLRGGGHRIVRHKYDLDGRALYCDLFDETSWSLHEAKGDVTRESVRMAVGQLLDYSRFYDRRPQMVLLLPRGPSEDMGKFLATVGIESVYRDCGGGWSPDVFTTPTHSNS